MLLEERKNKWGWNGSEFGVWFMWKEGDVYFPYDLAFLSLTFCLYKLRRTIHLSFFPFNQEGSGIFEPTF